MLDRASHKICLKHCGIRTEKPYFDWVRRHVHFHGVRHPSTLGAEMVETFLTHLAARGNVTAATPNQATRALLLRAFWGGIQATF